MNSNYLGLDIGGSHISIGLINEGPIDQFDQIAIDSDGSATYILDLIAQKIKAFASNSDVKSIDGIGISMPGPFEYEKGISKICNLGKYEELFGLNFRHSLLNRLNGTFSLTEHEVHFVNDAQAFLLGAIQAQGLKEKKVLGLTIGTGFGAATNAGEYILLRGSENSSKYLFNTSFKDGIAEDYFSTRWFIDRYNELSKNGKGKLQNVKQLASRFENDEDAQSVFSEFGENLGVFLREITQLEVYDRVVIGGRIAKSQKLFQKPLFDEIPNPEKVNCVSETSAYAIRGAVEHCVSEIGKEQKTYRNTSQHLLPVEKNNSPSGYDVYPTFKLDDNLIEVGYETLADWIAEEESVIIDGYGGVLWEDFVSQLNQHLQDKGKSVNWYCVDAALKDDDKIDQMVAPFLGGDDPIFGHRYPGGIEDFFESDKLERVNVDSESINIVYGSGAAVLDHDASVIYVDVPKNEIQYRSRAGRVCNLGSTKKQSPKEQYKRFYFVDWPVLNRHKNNMLDSVDAVVDEQRVDQITWMQGSDFRDGLADMKENVIRARPWFESGVWGGSWISDHIEGLSEEVPNYAWSFELIVPENGIIMESSRKMLEVSFDSLLYHDNEAMLGDSADLFGYEFPIRFDFLDTFDGQNLSLQCHPTEGYIYKNFGEKFTQDETYYMLDCGEESEVYLGFQDGVDKDQFRLDLEQSYEQKNPVDVKNYVQTFESSKHDLFLIPSGTVHCSGEDNLVLEISNTPYIFTFKMYDWLRVDLDGNPRPINIERAFENLDFSRQGESVEEELISTPETIEEGADWKVVNLPTHPKHFYAIHRMELDSRLDRSTNGKCHVLSLVEGETITVKTQNREQEVRYAETFVIPAAAESYEIINNSDTTAKVVKAFVKDEEEIKMKPYKSQIL